MALAITSAPTSELLSVEEAKRHLRLMSSDLDDEVQSKIRAARDYCERWTQRTLRTSTIRTLKIDRWWGATCDYQASGINRYSDDRNALRLPWPPLLTVSGITYYDTDNASQTLGSSNYQVELSTDGGGRVIWASTATIPALYARQDAVTITFTTGYASADAAPPVAMEAMKLAVSMLWPGRESERELNERSIRNLLAGVDWTGYV